MYVGQVMAIVDKYGCRLPPSFDGPADQAVLEASLMHLRLLDEFLRNDGRGLKACDWITDWQPIPWLDEKVRDRLNEQVAHLSPRRDLRYEWSFCAYGAAYCQELVRFFDEVRESCGPARLEAFDMAP